MKQRIRDYFIGLSSHKWLYPSLFIFSFLESIIIPIPLEFILVPLMLGASHKRVWTLAGTALLGFLAGASVGYFSAMFLFDQLAPWLLSTQESQDYYAAAKLAMQQDGFWYLFAAGITPVPTQIAMLAAGSTGFAFGLFLVAMTITRAIRYFALAWLISKWGEPGYRWVKAHKSVAKKLAVALLVLAILYEVLT